MKHLPFDETISALHAAIPVLVAPILALSVVFPAIPAWSPYWSCHGMDCAMTFGAYVRNFGVLIYA